MGSHFHDWIDYNGVAFSIESSRVAHFLWVRQFFIFTGSKPTRIFVLQMKSKVFFIQSKMGQFIKIESDPLGIAKMTYLPKSD